LGKLRSGGLDFWLKGILKARAALPCELAHISRESFALRAKLFGSAVAKVAAADGF